MWRDREDLYARINVRVDRMIEAGLVPEVEAPEMRYGIHLRETTGMIRDNLIRGVDEAIHVPKALEATVDLAAAGRPDDFGVGKFLDDDNRALA